MAPSASSDRVERVVDIFNAVVELAPEGRKAFLDKECTADLVLHQEVLALLGAYEQTGPLDALERQSISPWLRSLHASLSYEGHTVSHYQVLEQLGGGGMGVVYKALDTKLDRLVALKFLPSFLSTQEEARVRFIQEAKTASALDHPNICTVHEIGETEAGQLFIAMAYYAGETLKKKIERGPLPVEDALDYACQIAEGLARAHEAGIVHRDVKPANVMVTERGRVKVLDFGIAKMQDRSLTQTGRPIGTVAYMSPEQARGEEVDRRTDLWSLGVVLYEMLTGKEPFRGGAVAAMLYAIQHDTPEPVRALRPEVPEALEWMVERLLQKDPEARYQTAGEVVADLRVLQRGGEVLPGLVAWSHRALRRRQALLGGAGLVVLALVGLVLLRPGGEEPFPVDRNRILVLPFENRTGQASLDAVGMMAADLIRDGLTGTGFIKVEDEPTTMAVREYLEAEGDGEGRPWLAVLREAAEAGTVVTGKYYRQGDSIRFQVEFFDVEEEQMLPGVPPVKGPVAAPDAAMASLQERVLGALAVQLDPRLAEDQRHLSSPPSYAAYQAYREGTEITAYNPDALSRRAAHYERAYALDTTFVSALLKAAISYRGAGGNLNAYRSSDTTRSRRYYERGDSLMVLVEQSRERLSEYEWHLMDFHNGYRVEDPQGVYRSAKSMLRAVPGSERAIWQVAHSAYLVNRFRETIELLEPVDTERGLRRKNQYRWLIAESYHLLGEHRRELRVVEEGIRLYPDDRYMQDDMKPGALVALGRMEEVLRLLEQEGEMPGSFLLSLGAELRAHGHPEAALDVLARAIAWSERQPDDELRLYITALAHYFAGRWEQARLYFEQLAQMESLRHAPYYGTVLQMRPAYALAAIEARLGHRQQALAMWEAIEAERKPSERWERWFVYHRASLAAVLGDKEEALRLLARTFGPGVEGSGMRYWAHLNVDLESLRAEPRYQELFRPKG